ncbi:MAG: CsgG/HfaB family protein [Spirochaetia bacterium]|nr:CsgG/HfaB family protein [Spirochaetia bacterium]
MRNFIKIIIYIIIASEIIFTGTLSALEILNIFDSPVQKTSKYISNVTSGNDKKKAAILPFQSLDQKNESAGKIVSEDIIVNIVNDHKIDVVERTQVDKLLSELQFNQTGVIDSDKAKKIGKGLGADVIVMGSYSEFQSIFTKESMLKFNIKVVDTETFKVIGANQFELKNTWKDKTETINNTSSNTSYQNIDPERLRWFSLDLGFVGGLKLSDASQDVRLYSSTIYSKSIYDFRQTVKQAYLAPPVSFRMNVWFSSIFGFGMNVGYEVWRLSGSSFTSSNTYRISSFFTDVNLLFRIPIHPRFFPYASLNYAFFSSKALKEGQGTGIIRENEMDGYAFGGKNLNSFSSAKDIFAIFSYTVGLQWNITSSFGVTAEYQILNAPAITFYGRSSDLGYMDISAYTQHRINVMALFRIASKT